MYNYTRYIICACACNPKTDSHAARINELAIGLTRRVGHLKRPLHPMFMSLSPP